MCPNIGSSSCQKGLYGAVNSLYGLISFKFLAGGINKGLSFLHEISGNVIADQCPDSCLSHI